MRKFFFYLSLFSSVLLVTCQKEISFDSGGTPSEGSMLDDGSGNCLPKTVNGSYIAQASLTNSNTIQVTVNVTKVGSYNIFSDTINNYYFKATGIFSTLGSHSVTLKGSGKPLQAEVDNFLIQYDSTACSVPVTVLPAGTANAVMTMDCSNATINGTYQSGTILTSSNTVVLPVTVTTAGAYSISGSGNGMTFSGSGTVTTSTTSITLQGNGTPTTAQTTNITVSFGTSNCSFSVTVTAGGGGGGGTPDWKFTEGANNYQGTNDQAQLQVIGPAEFFNLSGSNSTDQLILSLVDLSGVINVNETYTSSSTSGNACGFIFSGVSEMYTAATSTPSVTLTIKVTAINRTAKTISGTFSGQALNASNVAKTITGGQFTATYQ